jgi:hypothetical protein
MANTITGYLTLKTYLDYLINEKTLTAFAKKIRKISNSSDKLTVNEMLDILNNIQVVAVDDEAGTVNLSLALK